MRILFLDIDGYVVKADIQKYVSQIELFGDEPIKDFEYIKNCIQYMFTEAMKKENNQEEVTFIKKVYDYVSTNMFEMLKEHRDCFLEYDNLISFNDKKQYIEDYQKNPVIDSNSKNIPSYMEYIIGALKYAKVLIENEYNRVKREGGSLHLPFKIINEDNDIIHYTENEDPRKRAESALKRMEMYAMNRELGRDDFLTACMMAGDNQIVDYNKIYVKENLIPGCVDSLKYLLDTKQVDMIIACSHYTGPREAIAKNRLFKEELPFVFMLPESLLKFHTEPAQMGKRRGRSSKNNQINLMIQIICQLFGYDKDQVNAILGDDSKPNLDGLSDEKVGILYRKLTEGEINSGLVSDSDTNIVRQFIWNTDEMERLFGLINKKTNTGKKLIKSNLE